MSNFYLKQGDREPKLERTLKWNDGTVIDLTGCTVTIKMVSDDGTVLIDAASCTVVSASAGTVQFAWRSGDTDAAGTHRADFTVTYPDSRKLSVPNKGHVLVHIEQAL